MYTTAFVIFIDTIFQVKVYIVHNTATDHEQKILSLILPLGSWFFEAALVEITLYVIVGQANQQINKITNMAQPALKMVNFFYGIKILFSYKKINILTVMLMRFDIDQIWFNTILKLILVIINE